MDITVLILALGSNFFFALGSQFFTYFSHKVGATWMNYFKAVVAQICFSLWIIFAGEALQGDFSVIGPLLLSGLIGLGAGDVLLLLSFKEMGPGRTLMLFAFQPLLMGLAGFLFFDQHLDSTKFWAIFFFILCILIFSLENFRKERNWGMRGIFLALGGMTMDTGGVVITRFIYDGNIGFSPLLTNFYRTWGAIGFFIFLSIFRKDLKLWAPLKTFSAREKGGVVMGSLFGTFISLTLFLTALQSAHLASLSGIAITGTIFSAMFECLWHRRLPSRYLMASFVSFFLGMKVLLF